MPSQRRLPRRPKPLEADLKILIATDAWHPQVNGVVRTLSQLVREAPALGATIELLTPDLFRTVAMPGYPEIRLALAPRRAVESQFDRIGPGFVHIATEGPLGHAVRGICLRRGLPFTTSFHTRFPEYLSGRLPLPQRWTEAAAWAVLRRFHGRGAAVMAATPSLAGELSSRGFHDVRLWPRGVDARIFHPRADADFGLPRPVFMTVGRLAVEKNVAAFLSLDLPGSKVVIGDGPARADLQRRFSDAHFLGSQHGETLAGSYAAADVFVFPSRTDTYGLVLLEALASGVPVAAFPADAPRDVIGAAPVGALDEDLRVACLKALMLSRQAARDFALTLSWQASTQAFLDHVAQANKVRRRRRFARLRPKIAA